MGKFKWVLLIAILLMTFAFGYLVGDASAINRINKQIGSSAPVSTPAIPEKKSNEELKKEPRKKLEESTGETSEETTLPAEQTINDVTVTLKKVEQDEDSLKLYVTYTNNSKNEITTNDSLTKIVHNGKQYEYDSGFNFDRYYEKDVDNAPHSIEPTVSADSVIFFEPISNVDKINIVFHTNIEDYRFNNVEVKTGP
jgi:hypothetical protein